MQNLTMCLVVLCAVAASVPARAAGADGLVGEWNFTEGRGTVAADSSGNNHPAQLRGASWDKVGQTCVVSLDGVDDYVDCGPVSLTGPVSLELWVKPTRKANGEACLFGLAMQGFLLTYYNTEITDWYIGDGSNGQYAQLELNEWNHVVGTFDGKQKSLWVNGRLVNSIQSKFLTYAGSGTIRIGTEGRPDLPHFKGMVSRARVYNRALPAEEITAHFKAEVAQYGFDPKWLTQARVVPYFYIERGDVVVAADYRGLQPLQGKGKLNVAVFAKDKPAQPVQQKMVDGLPEVGLLDVTLPIGKLPDGDYVLRVTLSDDKGPKPAEEFGFSCPEKPKALPAPGERVVGALPAPAAPTPYEFKVGKGGGFALTVKGVSYQFQSRISWPNGNFNRMSGSDVLWPAGEKSWKVQTRQEGDHRWIVDAGGDFYSLRRELELLPTHVNVKDTYTNLTGKDLGLLIYNEMPLKPGQATGSWLSGFERWGRQLELGWPDYSPTTFVTDRNTGMGIIPVDDVYVIQALPYVEEQAAGVCTEKFALGAGKSYTLEWAVYPAGSGDYYDFINNFRQAEERIGTVTDVPGFIGRRGTPDQSQVDRLNMKIAIIPSISNAIDDPNLYLEGFEFVDFPKEMEALKDQADRTKRLFPGMKIIPHIAHSLYCTNKPDRFADSKVITERGTQSTWGDGSDFGPQRKAENWRWWIFYPVPGNSFHNAMMKSVDIMMDQMHMDGGFMDGFFAGYTCRWSYDTELRWDGHSAEIDMNTKTVKRRMNSVLLLSQPSMVEYARKIRDKGGVVIANNSVFTRTIAAEKHITFDLECSSGPQQHLAPNVIGLAKPWGPSLKDERDVYLDVLDKLSWGMTWFSYGEPWSRFSDPHSLALGAREYPITFEEIRPGLVRGKERIITYNSGIYGWSGDHRLHAVYKYDDRGSAVKNDCTTSVDVASVRTELKFAKNESAVIEPIPLTLEAASAVNVRVLRYDSGGIALLLNGQGDATLRVGSGTFAVKDGENYGVMLAAGKTSVAARENGLTVPLKLSGPAELRIGLPHRALAVRSAPVDGAGILGTLPGAAPFTADVDDMTPVTLIAPPFVRDSGAEALRGFVATQNAGGGTLIMDGKGNRVKVLDHGGRAMAFDRDGNIFVGDDVQSGGKYPVWRYARLGEGNWSAAEKYCDLEGMPRALAMDSARGVLYIGLTDAAPWISNVYRCMKRGDAPTLFCGVNDGGRQIQDIEVGPDGKVWMGLMAWGYLRFPLAGGLKPEFRLENNGSAGGFAFGPDRDGDGRPELYGNVNSSLNDFGCYNAETGKQLCTLFSDETGKLGNYCMTFGPDRNDNGFADIYVCAYDDRIRVFDGLNGARLGEMAEKCPNIYIAGWVPEKHRFVRWTLDGVAQPDGQTAISFKMTGPRTAIAQYEPVGKIPASGK